MQSYYSCQSGRSMVEILGVLAVIGVLSVGGIAAYSKAMEKINTDQLIVDISTTARKIKNLYADQKSYEDLDQQVYTLNLVAGAHKIAIATLFTNAALPGSTNKHKNVNIFFLTGRRQPFSSCFYVSNAA